MNCDTIYLGMMPPITRFYGYDGPGWYYRCESPDHVIGPFKTKAEAERHLAAMMEAMSYGAI